MQNLKIIIGHLLSDKVVVYTLNGLRDEYNKLAIIIRARNSSISSKVLYDK